MRNIYIEIVIDEMCYYPFGLTMNGISSKALNYGTPNNRLKFNGKEEQTREFTDNSGLEWLDFGARMFDPQIGRWNVLDPLAEKDTKHSPYNFALNNPLIIIDPDGMESTSAGDGGAKGSIDEDDPTGLHRSMERARKGIGLRGMQTEIINNLLCEAQNRNQDNIYNDDDNGAIESEGAWEIHNKWNEEYIKMYEEYTKIFGSLEFYNPTKDYDCADYGFELIINFASENNLPLKFKYFSKGKLKVLDASSNEFSSKSEYLAKAKNYLGAVHIMSNSIKISIKSTTAGDLLMTKYDNAVGYTGHTRIVFASLKQANGDYLLQWLQATLPAGPIRGYQEYFSVLKEKLFQNAPRRWDFNYFNN